MMPLFGNPAGLWVLLGVPALVAIHMLQQRSQVARTSTWFLIETLAPDSARGRTWDRWRGSRTFWLQVVAVLLAAWVLGEPRWVRRESTQTVVVVLDASASMEAFRAAATEAASRELAQAAGLAARTTWVIMTTDPGEPALYRGPEREAARAALAGWRPEAGRHDPAPALRLARALAGADGRTLLITDTRAKVPADQRAAGVGEPIENVGFAGATVTREPDGAVWRALVKNHGTATQRRTWQVETAGAKSEPQALELAPGAIVEVAGRLPDGADRATVRLAPDRFAADDGLPLVVPRAKPLAVAVEPGDAAAAFLRKLAEGVDGVTLVAPAAEATATLRLAAVGAAGLAREGRGGIFWPPEEAGRSRVVANEPVAAERDPLVAGLTWQGWIGAGPTGYAVAPGDVPLLWQGRRPLVILRPPAPASAAGNPGVEALRPPAGRKLLLAFDWSASNAARLPATVLMVRRFLEAERDAQRAPYAANFDCGGAVGLAGLPADGECTLDFEPAVAGAGPSPARRLTPAERTGLRAPGRAGFFTVRRGGEVIVRGSAQFADARQGDFRAAERFEVEVRNERTAAIERHTRSDPFAAGWLVLLGAAMLASWWTAGGRSGAVTGSGPGRGETGREEAGAA